MPRTPCNLMLPASSIIALPVEYDLTVPPTLYILQICHTDVHLAILEEMFLPAYGGPPQRKDNNAIGTRVRVEISSCTTDILAPNGTFSACSLSLSILCHFPLRNAALPFACGRRGILIKRHDSEVDSTFFTTISSLKIKYFMINLFVKTV